MTWIKSNGGAVHSCAFHVIYTADAKLCITGMADLYVYDNVLIIFSNNHPLSFLLNWHTVQDVSDAYFNNNHYES